MVGLPRPAPIGSDPNWRSEVPVTVTSGRRLGGRLRGARSGRAVASPEGER
jgi:hypothetical protein